jgi:hypothetical protein
LLLGLLQRVHTTISPKDLGILNIKWQLLCCTEIQACVCRRLNEEIIDVVVVYDVSHNWNLGSRLLDSQLLWWGVLGSKLIIY